MERDRGHGGRGAVWSSGKCGRRSSGATRATQESLDRENDVRYDFVHTVTHRRLLTETNKSPAAIGRPGMIASRYERDQQNQLLGRRRAFRVLCRSDLLSGSMIAFVVRSEVLVPCAVYAGTLPCQADRIDSSRVHLNSLRALARKKCVKEARITAGPCDMKGAAGIELMMHERKKLTMVKAQAYAKTGMVPRLMLRQRLEEWENRYGCRSPKCRLANSYRPGSQDCRYCSMHPRHRV